MPAFSSLLFLIVSLLCPFWNPPSPVVHGKCVPWRAGLFQEVGGVHGLGSWRSGGVTGKLEIWRGLDFFS